MPNNHKKRRRIKSGWKGEYYIRGPLCFILWEFFSVLCLLLIWKKKHKESAFFAHRLHSSQTEEEMKNEMKAEGIETRDTS